MLSTSTACCPLSNDVESIDRQQARACSTMTPFDSDPSRRGDQCPSPHPSSHLKRHLNQFIRFCKFLQSSEASERRGDGDARLRNVETTGARVSYRPRNIFPHFCMLFLKLPLFVVMLPTFN